MADNKGLNVLVSDKNVFKCCKNKETNNVICIKCFSVQHKSCFSRKGINSARIISDNKIVCCDNNDMDINSQLEERSLMDELLCELVKENENKDKHILKLKRDNASFTEIALINEEEIIAVNKKQQDEIKSLKKQLTSLKKQIQVLETKNETDRHRKQKTSSTQTEDKTVNIDKSTMTQSSPLKSYKTKVDRNTKGKKIQVGKQNMDTRVNDGETSIQENIANVKQNKGIKILRNLKINFNDSETKFPNVIEMVGQDNRGKPDIDGSPEAPLNSEPLTDIKAVSIDDKDVGNHRNNLKPNNIHSVSGTSKIMILCDEYGSNLNVLLKRLVNKENKDIYKIETIKKPAASLSGVIEDIESLSRMYSLNDYIIIMAGTNDFSNNKYPLFKGIHNKIKNCTHTNIIFTTVPFCPNGKNNKYINKYNNKLNEYLFKLNRSAQGNIRLLDINNKSGALLNKTKIANKLAYLIRTPSDPNKTLIFVHAHKSMEKADSDRSAVNISDQEEVVSEVIVEGDKSVAVEILETGTKENENHFLDLKVLHNISIV